MYAENSSKSSINSAVITVNNNFVQKFGRTKWGGSGTL